MRPSALVHDGRPIEKLREALFIYEQKHTEGQGRGEGGEESVGGPLGLNYDKQHITFRQSLETDVITDIIC